MISRASTRRYWEARIAALARRINTAAWLDRLAPAVFFAGSVFAAALYAARRHEFAPGARWWLLAAALGVAAAAAAWRARRDCFSRAEARVLLETRLRLETRLTAAELGLVPWPPEPMVEPRIVRWRVRAPLGWFAAAAALVAAAAWLPVSPPSTAPRFAGAPPSLLQTEAMLEALKQTAAAAPEALEQLAQRAAELARRPADEQFSHSALEAADALRQQTVAAAAGLGRGLDDAARALRSAGPGADLGAAVGRLGAALGGLRESALPANPDLLAHLPASAAELGALSAEELKQLADALAAAAAGVQGVAGAFGAGANVAQPDPNAEAVGAGGEGGGGESAPLQFAAQGSEAGAGSLQALSPGSLKRFSLGDKLGTTTAAHTVDPQAAAAPTSAGAVAAPAAGGEAVWVDRLTPAERAALKTFFR